MRLPFLKNFRRGFATNSSSSHSFVYLKQPTAGLEGETPTSAEFGWNDFRLDTLREKLFYALVSRIGGNWNATAEDVDETFETYSSTYPEFTREDFKVAMEGYVDHESVGTISDMDARDPHVVVFGGNDNDGDSAERAALIRSGAIDWDRTKIEYDDRDHLRPDDVVGHTAWEKSFGR